jgi:hypothetical protein
MRGTSIPCVVELTSSIAELSAAAPVPFTAIPCALTLPAINITNATMLPAIRKVVLISSVF